MADKRLQLVWMQLVLIGFSTAIFGQNIFKGSVSLGINFCQTTGDYIAGYNKLGLNGSFNVGFDINKNMAARVDFLYEQQGSRQNFDLNPFSKKSGLQLHYLGMAFNFRLKDWYQEKDDYHKVWIEMGLIPKYLIYSEVNNSLIISSIQEDFNRLNLSASGGLYYAITKKYCVGILYSYSLSLLYHDREMIVDNLERLRPYHLGIKQMYHF